MEGKYRPASIPFVNGIYKIIKVGSHIIHIYNKVKYIHGVHVV